MLKRMKTRRPFRGSRRSGQAFLELSFIVPVLLVLAIGILQMTVILTTMNTLQQIAREGARVAAKTANNNPTLYQSLAITAMTTVANTTPVPYSSLGFTGVNSGNAVAFSGTVAEGNPITVVVYYDMRKKFFVPVGSSTVKSHWLPWNDMFKNAITMSATMVIE